MAAGPVVGADTAVGDAVTLAAWCVLTVAATVVLVRRPAARCGVWFVVGFACVVVAVDKAFDLQDLGYRSLRVLARAVETMCDLPEHDPRVRAGRSRVQSAGSRTNSPVNDGST